MKWRQGGGEGEERLSADKSSKKPEITADDKRSPRRGCETSARSLKMVVFNKTLSIEAMLPGKESQP